MEIYETISHVSINQVWLHINFASSRVYFRPFTLCFSILLGRCGPTYQKLPSWYPTSLRPRRLQTPFLSLTLLLSTGLYSRLLFARASSTNPLPLFHSFSLSYSLALSCFLILPPPLSLSLFSLSISLSSVLTLLVLSLYTL